MALPLLAIAAVAAQAWDRQKKQQEARKAEEAGVYERQAAQLGASTEGVGAARSRRKIDDTEGEDYLKQLLPLLQGYGGAGGGS